MMTEEGEMEVVWSGTLDRQGACKQLIAPRETKVTDSWTPPNRAYNKTGKHSKKPGFVTEGDIIDVECVKSVDNPAEILDDIDRLNGAADPTPMEDE